MIDINELKEKISKIDERVNELKNSIYELTSRREKIIDEYFYQYLLQSKVLGQFPCEVTIDYFPKITLDLSNKIGQNILEAIHSIGDVRGYHGKFCLSNHLDCNVDFDNQCLEIDPYSSDYDQVNEDLKALGIEQNLEELWNWAIQQEEKFIADSRERIEKLRQSMLQMKMS